MTTNELISYYANLLILQYVGKPRAFATIETYAASAVMVQVSTQSIAFSAAPSSGTFVLNYGLLATAAINWNDSVGTIQGKIQALTGLSSVTVTGSIASALLVITFTGVTPPAAVLTASANSLGVTITIAETDVTLPVAVQNAFNLIGPNPAVGAQLDILGKYAGVTRTGAGFEGQPITLGDADFLQLINMAILKNNAGSSLATIQQLLNQAFPGDVLVFDYQNMQMSYLFSTAIGSQELVQLFITEGLLPAPMAVAVAAVIYAPIINTFFGFRTYALPGFNNSPFNSYSSYQTNRPWLSYGNAVNV